MQEYFIECFVLQDNTFIADKNKCEQLFERIRMLM